MITTSTNSKESKRHAFTLVEMMVAVLIFSIALTSILSTFIVFAKSAVSVGGYAEMSSESRKALELFSRDIRSADALTVINAKIANSLVYTDSGITLSYPAYYGERTVSYGYSSGSFTRTEVYDGTTTTEKLLSGVSQLKIKFYQTPGNNFSAVSGPLASVDIWTKSVQLDAELLRNVVSIDNTDYIISARFMMRN